MLRYLMGACLVILAMASTPARAEMPRCEPEKAAIKYPNYANRVVKIAASPTQQPYAYTDPKDMTRLTGLEVEMIEGAMKCAGLKYEFVKGAWAGLLQSMFNGASDVMIGAVNYRKDRAEKVDFVLYTRAGGTAVVQKGNPKKITSLDRMCGTSGSATVGGSSALLIDKQSKACLEQGRPAINFQPAADADAAYRQVSNGRIDFAMDDSGSAAARLANDPNFEHGLTIMSDLVGGFVIPKGNDAMLRAVADGLMVQQESGALKALMEKYHLDPELMIPVQIKN